MNRNPVRYTGRGQQNPMWSGRLLDVDVRNIKIALAQGARQADLSREYNVDRRVIQAIASGKKWGWLDV